MDKMSKLFLKHFNSKPNPEEYVCWRCNEDDLKEAIELNITIDEFYNIIKYLVNQGYFEYLYYSNSKKIAGFKLTHNGLHYKEFQYMKIKKYIASKWIDFLALIIAIAAFIQSCIALS